MKPGIRLGLFGLVLVTLFGAAAFTASVVVPDRVAQESAKDDKNGSEHSGHGSNKDKASDANALGLSLGQDGYRLTEVDTPGEAESNGELSLVVIGPDGKPVTDFDVQHDKELHLIVVRADGQQFRHVHPELAKDGTWSLPWRWNEGGTYRVFADFIPAQTGKGLTLSTAVQVAGSYEPVAPAPAKTANVHDYEVAVHGDLTVGEPSELTMTVSKDGEPVTELQPYLAAFGHLVTLREGDLAYLHAHPHGDAPKPDETSGPDIIFEVNAPTPGQYLLYLDFKINGEVHTAPLVLNATASGATDDDSGTHDPSHDEEGSGHDHD